MQHEILVGVMVMQLLDRPESARPPKHPRHPACRATSQAAAMTLCSPGEDEVPNASTPSSRRLLRIISMLSGVPPLALIICCAVYAGQCHGEYRMPMRWHGVTPSGCVMRQRGEARPSGTDRHAEECAVKPSLSCAHVLVETQARLQDLRVCARANGYDTLLEQIWNGPALGQTAFADGPG